jgi:hypothetical protein
LRQTLADVLLTYAELFTIQDVAHFTGDAAGTLRSALQSILDDNMDAGNAECYAQVSSCRHLFMSTICCMYWRKSGFLSAPQSLCVLAFTLWPVSRTKGLEVCANSKICLMCRRAPRALHSIHCVLVAQG